MSNKNNESKIQPEKTTKPKATIMNKSKLQKNTKKTINQQQ